MVRVLKPAELQPSHVSTWHRIIAENPRFASPFFSPEYSLAVSQVIPNVWVGVQHEDDEPVAFLPFERSPEGIGSRLRFCDFQGVVSIPGKIENMREFIRNCGLQAWEFDHLLADQTESVPYHQNLHASYCMDLTQGFEDYIKERTTAGTSLIKKTRNLERRLEREHGQLRFELHDGNPSILTKLLEWRTSKYPKARHPPEIEYQILRELLVERSSHCHGTLSVFYVNDEIAACHFGLRSPSAWHYWFPAYNPKLELFSPGNILLLRMAETAAKMGIRTIDLGKGEQDYKKRFSNKTVSIAEGYVSASTWLSVSRSIEDKAKRCVRRSPFLKSLARRVRGIQTQD